MMVFRKRHSLILVFDGVKFESFWSSFFKACIVIFCFACAMSPLHSHAHRMLVDHVVEGKSVSVDVFFPDGKPAKNVNVEVYRFDCFALGDPRADETLYLSGETDAEGRFSFDSGDETHLKVAAIGKLGHRAEQEISLSDATPQVSEEKTEGNRRREPIPLREIFAGFGYILGVAGILMYLKARSDLKKANASSGDR